VIAIPVVAAPQPFDLFKKQESALVTDLKEPVKTKGPISDKLRRPREEWRTIETAKEARLACELLKRFPRKQPKGAATSELQVVLDLFRNSDAPEVLKYWSRMA
jgi:hypothetical protein